MITTQKFIARKFTAYKTRAKKMGSALVASAASTYRGLTVATWDGSYDSIATATTFQRMTKTSVSIGELPSGITDNNDGSFTNDSGVTKTISGTIVASIYSAGRNLVLSAGTDESGSDAEIISITGHSRPYESSYTNGLDYIVVYSIELSNGKTVFPYFKDNSGISTLSLGALSHEIWSR